MADYGHAIRLDATDPNHYRARAEASRLGFGSLPNAARSCCSSSVDIVHLVIGAQLFERAGKPGVDRAGGDA